MSAALLAVTFTRAERLWLLALVVVLGLSHLVQQRRRHRYAMRFTNLTLLDSVAPKGPGWRRHLPAVLLLLALAAMIGAIARPAHPERVPRERATVVLALDTSLSMQATDVSPSRLAAAQAAATEFVQLLPERINVGLVTFNGTATVRVPPTQDRESVLTAIDHLRLGVGTAIGEAIFAALDAIVLSPPGPDGEEVPARIVLMSDGKTTVATSRPDAQAADAARRAGVPVSTIAFGTADGTMTLPGADGTISVRVEPEALARTADATGGTAFTAATQADLRRVYEDIGSSVGHTTVLRDITDAFLVAAVVLLGVAAALSQRWFHRMP